MFPKMISPIFAHLGTYKTLGRISKKQTELRKAKKLTKTPKKEKNWALRAEYAIKNLSQHKS